nr:MAG TPA: hypothetical protein [Caudoviricetes sp.]
MVPSIPTGMIKGASNAPDGLCLCRTAFRPFVATARARIATAEEVTLELQ